ncbi:MAG: plasmid mobilization protein [Opitutales bacterium]
MAAAKKTKPKRRKSVLKEESIHIRLTEEQKEGLTEAATKAGLGLSTWLLTLGLREMQKAESGK